MSVPRTGAGAGAGGEDFEQSISSFFNEKDNNFDLDDQHHVASLPAHHHKNSPSDGQGQGQGQGQDQFVISRDHLVSEDLHSSVEAFFADENNNFDLNDQHQHRHAQAMGKGRGKAQPQQAAAVGLVDLAELERELERFAPLPDDDEEAEKEATMEPQKAPVIAPVTSLSTPLPWAELDEQDQAELAKWLADLQRRKQEKARSAQAQAQAQP